MHSFLNEPCCLHWLAAGTGRSDQAPHQPALGSPAAALPLPLSAAPRLMWLPWVMPKASEASRNANTAAPKKGSNSRRAAERAR